MVAQAIIRSVKNTFATELEHYSTKSKKKYLADMAIIYTKTLTQKPTSVYNA